MKIIVGLGNPGLKYEATRHNAGFMVIDLLAKKLGIKVKKIKWKSLYEKVNLRGESIILLKPQTFMNNSGIAVKEIVDYFGVDIEDLIVIYDDIDIPFGTIRIKKSGSSGSHNGMKSIIYHLNDDSFPRIRLSIGKKPDYFDLADYVLSGFSKKEAEVFDREVSAAASAVERILSEGLDAAMNEFNGMDYML
ncbi:MAG: aminoacyl-tRNA hydrolase [Tissierellia bacterium]|nr:aminoacyl-tRNA hydrolase [Tissierellia bacterium]